MPLSAARRRAYPGGSLRSPEWKAIRKSILARAEGRCEGTTQFPECRAVNAQPHPETGSRVVLTIAHMDHDPSHNDETNLRALCQRCHLAWNHRIHVVNAGATRRHKAAKAELPDMTQPSLWAQIGEELPVLTGPVVQPVPIVEVSAPTPSKPASAEKHALAPGMRRPRAGEGWWVRHCVQKTSPAGSTPVLREVVGVTRPRESVVIADLLLWDGLIARVEITGFPALEGLDFLWDDAGVPGTRFHWDEAARSWTRIPHT